LKSALRSLPRFGLALAFTLSATTAMIVGGAQHAGTTPATRFNAAPAAADAAVFVGVGVHFGNYPRWRWSGYSRSWVHAGYYYGAPGFIANVGFAGYAAPYGPPYWAAAYYPHYYHPYYYHPYYQPVFYGRSFYGPGFYGRGYYGGGYYGHGSYGGGYYGRGSYGRGYGGGYSRGGSTRGYRR
jgi:hypothetical protein